MTNNSWIQNRKKEALSSYISENLFEKFFLKDVPNITFSSGWWISTGIEGKKYAFLNKNNLNTLDKELTDILQSNDLPVYQITTNINRKEKFMIRDMSTSSEMTIHDFVTTYNQDIYHTKKNNQIDVQDSSIKNSYLEYYRNAGILDAVKQSIELEDVFLNKYFYSTNMDFFVRNELGILLFEIKYKFKDKSNCFGINKMQYNVINMLQKFGIRAYNVILENIDKKDILDTILNNDYHWIHNRIDPNLADLKIAPAKTSYFKNSQQKYYPVQSDFYKNLLVDSNIINLRCPICGNKLVLRKKYTEFLGCSQFPSKGCRGKIDKI